MSAQTEAVSAPFLRYLAEHTTREDAFLGDLRRHATAAGIPAIWIAPEQAALMQVLLRVGGARQVVEVGTLAGYSAICMARALPKGGRVRTLELSPERAAFAREWVAKSDVAGMVEVLVGDARQTLATLADGSADACFIDADKESYPFYLEHCLRITRANGLIMVDNAFAFGQVLQAGDAEVEAIRAFNAHVAADPRLRAVIVPLGDGLWVGARVAKGSGAT